MSQKILPALVISALLFSSQTFAQKNSAFAVTAETKGNVNWNVIREIDLSTGEVLRTVYNPSVNKNLNYRAVSGTEFTNTAALPSATGAGVAAAAFDAVHNRLYFTNMRANELLYFDFASNEMSVVVNNNPAFNSGNKHDEGNVITRMAFGSDGYGYALSNDGKNFIRFSTDQKPSVTNLGELIDGKKNGAISVHSQCSSWGGDMVGDAYGNMYLVTYRNHLFKINPQTRIADYIGQIKGLPAEFTSNGMVVNGDGELIVSSATISDNYYQINISTLQATVVNKKDDKVFNSSDLANGNLLYQSKDKVTDKFIPGEVKGNQAVSMYPNPVVNKSFNLQFEKVPAGKYNLLLTDASGRNVVSKSLTINAYGQVEKVAFPRTAASGMYLVKLTGSDSKVFYYDKIVVE